PAGRRDVRLSRLGEGRRMASGKAVPPRGRRRVLHRRGLSRPARAGAGNPVAGFGHEKAMEPSDAVLWARSRTGDTDAFGILFERHARAIYGYCFRRVGNWATAEELLSVVFLEAWRRRGKELPPDKVLPWLYGIATNVVRNQRRWERRFAKALSRMPAGEPEPDFAGKSDERVDDEWQAQGALDLLRRLPRREQDVFMLCAVAELSYE